MTTSIAATATPQARGSGAPPELDLMVLLKALHGLKDGDFSVELPSNWVGVEGKIADAFNDIVRLNRHTCSEFERLSRVVGRQGKLTQRAMIGAGLGDWAETITAVNVLIDDLVHPTTETARVIGAVAKGDLTQSMTVEVDGRPLQGEFRRTALTVNTMVDQLASFASEVTRVAREVGTEGKLGGQAKVKGVAGTWKDLTDNVNLMASNLTSQVRNIATVTTAVANGDLSKKITVDVKGEILELKNTINTMVDQLNSFASEVTRVAREVGSEGRLGGQATVRGVAGTWKDLTDNVNSMAGNLTGQVRNIAHVTKAVAAGDLSKKITVDVQGEILELKNTINTMVDQLNSFASEVTRVAREVGTEGKLGGQADVRGVSGTWKDLTDNVNFMAGNLTSQVRGIAKVVTAVANGDLERKLTLEAKGEIAELADTINNMTDTLATFADQVTSVAREVGVEGQLGGQALVPGAAGTWKDLTDNVNQLAANLTTQVRAIADVATAVTKGDLTRSIAVAAQGEVAALKDNINEMIRNLKDTTIKNNEQDWLKTNLAKFSRMLQGQKDMLAVGKLILSELAPVVSAQQGVFYVLEQAFNDEARLRLLAGYALSNDHAESYRLGEGLIGQCAVEGKRILLADVPSGYARISSGLGEAKPANLMVLPVLFEGQVKGVMELSSFTPFSQTHELLLGQLTESIGIVLNTIEANTRTEDLLKQSQSLARELQSQQQELQKTNQQLEEKAGLLAMQNAEVEHKNQEVEQARSALEEKARQLALTSKYKSEFLANMSHELRTPLNSLLILSDQLSLNPHGNLIPKQVEYAKTIHASGNDLLSLINDILDLSKIESGTVTVEPDNLDFSDLRDYVLRTFSHVAESRHLGFNLDFAPNLPKSMHTDVKRLQQVLKNLLSNAFKFTEIGSVTISVAMVGQGWNPGNESLNRALGGVLGFTVTDTGIGIPPEKQQIIFDAFKQADGSTSRKYGGTGLGLAISRELAHMLGGEIHLSSAPGSGSSFTLLLPRTYISARVLKRTASEPRLPLAHISQREDPASADERIPADELADDRDAIEAHDLTVLIVENDRTLSSLLMTAVRSAGMRVLATAAGGEALALMREFRPSAVLLDARLADIEGWRILRTVKNESAIRHIPVQILAADEDRERALHEGAFGLLAKPIDRQLLDEILSGLRTFIGQSRRRLLVVEDEPARSLRIRNLVCGPDVEVISFFKGEEALAFSASERADGVIFGLTGTMATALVEQFAQSAGPRFVPVIIFIERELPHEETVRLRRVAKALIVNDRHAEARLLAEVSLCLHRPLAAMDARQCELLAQLHAPEAVLAGRRILVVDDDIRNIFAMTSLLERYDVEVVSAEDGKHAIENLNRDPHIELVLMDIMMPEMDGYDTMREIRRSQRFTSLPIIALTAKAMKGDREKCLDAGASDYIAKPIDPQRLVSLLCVWLYRGAPAPVERSRS